MSERKIKLQIKDMTKKYDNGDGVGLGFEYCAHPRPFARGHYGARPRSL